MSPLPLLLAVSGFSEDLLVSTLIRILIVVFIGAVLWWVIGVIGGETNPPNPFLRIARVLVAAIVAIIIVVLLLRLL